METENKKLESILVVYDDFEEIEGAKGILSGTLNIAQKIGVLNTEELAGSLKHFCGQMLGVFDSVTAAVKNYELDKIEIVIEITAKGEIKLIGGVSSDFKGGVKLIFSKTKAEKE